MKISHELPNTLLHYSYEWNDYDYCLPIFLDKYEQYNLFFEKAKKDNRFIIMDNSLFEGYVHTSEDLVSKINKFEPDIFIVPDEWNNSINTIRNAKSWMINYKKYLPEKTNLMAVLQGESIGELLITYQTLVDLGYKHIAINHSSKAYENLFRNNIHPLQKQMYGRFYLINQLIEEEVINKNYYHHLLGCSLPQELKFYNSKENYFIKSVDTSSPIINGSLRIKYTDNGLSDKPRTKIEELFNKDLSGQLEDIIFNVKKFKEYVKDTISL